MFYFYHCYFVFNIIVTPKITYSYWLMIIFFFLMLKKILDISKYFFFYLGFLSQPFTNHRTAEEGGGHLFNSSLPLPPASQTLDISWTITIQNSSLHIGSSRTRTGNLWFLRTSR